MCVLVLMGVWVDMCVDYKLATHWLYTGSALAVHWLCTGCVLVVYLPWSNCQPRPTLSQDCLRAKRRMMLFITRCRIRNARKAVVVVKETLAAEPYFFSTSTSERADGECRAHNEL